jgi:uncharacterized protein
MTGVTNLLQSPAPAYGPIALVTGASDGIGRAFARELARRGYNLVLVARRKAQLDVLANELDLGNRTLCTVIAADLGRPEGIAAVLEQTAARDIGLLVAAAGFGTSGNFIDQPLDAELEMIDVNCRAVAALTHGFGQRFAARGGGGIVLMSSIVGFQGVPRAANYAATKAFVQSLAEGLRPELAAKGVDIVACAPGPIASGFAARANMVMNRCDPPEVVAAETLDALGRKGIVRPGLLAKLLEAAFTGMPRWGRVKIMTLVMRGMARGKSGVAADAAAEVSRP